MNEVSANRDQLLARQLRAEHRHSTRAQQASLYNLQQERRS
jgi:hypothetical protein